MIRIESVQINEFRGIRELTLPIDGENFVISGPNGSGKSGVVDAIQFALTGAISRLKGAGTKELKLSEHGPHVVVKDYPDVSWVCLKVEIPHLGKSATITREVKNPKRPKILPDEEEVRKVFAELEGHPEITLSRREIIKFILTEATKRSQDVQTLLKLDRIDQVRAVLKTTENKLNSEFAIAAGQTNAAKAGFQRHLDIESVSASGLLEQVNLRRGILGLPNILELTKTTCVSEGISTEGTEEKLTDSKETAIKDLDSFLNSVSVGFEKPTEKSTAMISSELTSLEKCPELLPLVRHTSFLQSGLDLIDGPYCPFCGIEWDETHLREHVRRQLELSGEAKRIESSLLRAGLDVSKQIIQIESLIDSVSLIKELEASFLGRLERWRGELSVLRKAMDSVEGILAMKERFESGWASPPKGLSADLERLKESVKVRPEESGVGLARDYLVIAQDRLNSWRVARRNEESKRIAASRGKFAHSAYGKVAEEALSDLYQEVEDDFGKYYQLVNQDDEGEFSVKFQPANGKLGLVVDFHKKGMFPPGAYHSEGHQDGMGVCLYLALMRRVLGNRFSLAVLDDVVMSVDSQHRKRFCKLLKAHFPETQFIITTHDQVWAKQMRTEGVIGSRNSIAFHSWSVETGPILDEITEVWDQIEADLVKNDVGGAAGRLRRHLEFSAADLADELGAKVTFRGDGSHDLGDLLGAVIGRQGELLKKAAKAAKSWENAEDETKVAEWIERRREILVDQVAEQWVINKAIHYNDWANLSKEEFSPVAVAFRNLLEQFRCDKPKCGTWVAVTPRVNPTDLRCSCGALRLNLRCK